MKNQSRDAGTPGGEWQPIETAPKDGTCLLLYEPAGHYHNGVGFPAATWIGCWSQGDSLNPPHWTQGCVKGFPTHWIPLPDPPEVQS